MIIESDLDPRSNGVSTVFITTLNYHAQNSIKQCDIVQNYHASRLKIAADYVEYLHSPQSPHDFLQ